MPISKDVKLGKGVIIHHPELVNLYGCVIGSKVKIGSFVEIQKKAVIGDRCKISSHSFICEGVTIESDVFIGHNVTFINDRYPKASLGNRLEKDTDWKVVPVRIKKGASIGSSATIMCGITIGKEALVGAGSVVTRNVPDYAIVTGVPAKVMGDIRRKKVKQ